MTIRTAVAAMLALTAAPALAVDCTRAASAIDHAICANPKIKQADAELTRLYTQVRDAVAPSARVALLRQQKAWIARRDAGCKTAAPCLDAAYRARVAALTSLKASADAQDEPLTDVTPITLMGEWHVEKVVDPSGHALPADLSKQLAAADLPPPGSTIHAAPGRLCSGTQPCAAIGWTATKVGELQGGPRILADLRVPASTRAYIGASGSKWADHYTVIRSGDGSLRVLMTLCDAGGTNACRNAYELWRPKNAGGSLLDGG